MTKYKTRIDICCLWHNYQVEREELEAMVFQIWVLRMVLAMTIYKPLSPKALPHKGLSFHNHQKRHGKDEPVYSEDCARVLQMNQPCG